MNVIVEKTFDEMQEFLTNPYSRIVDSRMLEFYGEFSFMLQVLTTNGQIWQVKAAPEYVQEESGETRVKDIHQFRKEALDLFRLQYQNSPRQNPALYGLLDAADAESRVEQTLPITVR